MPGNKALDFSEIGNNAKPKGYPCRTWTSVCWQRSDMDSRIALGWPSGLIVY
jgi:hypothetical protein